MHIAQPVETLPSSALPFWRQLRWNLVLSYVLLALLPLAIVVPIMIARLNTAAVEQTTRQLESVAVLKQQQIIDWLEDGRIALKVFLADPARNARFAAFTASTLPSTDSSEAVPLSTVDLQEQTSLNHLLGDAVNVHPNLVELFIFNTNGQIVVASNPLQIGKLVNQQPYFTNSLLGEYIQTPYYAEDNNEVVMFITYPLVQQATGLTVGALAGRLDIRTLGTIMTERVGLGQTGETYLISSESNHLLTPSRFEAEGYVLTRAYHSEGIDQALAGQNGSSTYGNYRTPATPVIGVYRWLPELQVAMLAEISLTEAGQPFNQVRDLIIFVAVATSLLAVSVGLFVATRISRPVTLLTQAATQLARGEWEQTAPVTSRNEIGLLANAFNSMAVQLRDLVDSLEQRVAARTKALATSAEVSRSLSTILDPTQLAAEVVEQVRTAFGYYHAHIYLFDESRTTLVMAGGTGEAGQAMLAAGHRLKEGQGLVGRAAATNTMVLVPNVNEEPDWLPNPLLPDTKAEVAVPIALGGQVLGVLDVQHNVVYGLGQEEADLLQTIANQIAVAVQNARLYERTQKQAENEAFINAIGQKLQKATTLESVLQITAEALGQTLQVRRTRAQVGGEIPTTNGHS